MPVTQLSQPEIVRPAPAVEATPDLNALLIATGAGDRRAFEQLYKATNRRLFARALQVLKRREAAEDVLQEAFVRVWTQARRFDPARGPALAWLSRVTRNVAIDQIRRQRGPTEDIASHAETLAAPQAPLGERFDLNQGIARLKAEQRKVIKLAFIDGYTHEELGARLGVPLGTAKSRVRRSVEQLRAYFETEDTVWATRLPTNGDPAKD